MISILSNKGILRFPKLLPSRQEMIQRSGAMGNQIHLKLQQFDTTNQKNSGKSRTISEQVDNPKPFYKNIRFWRNLILYGTIAGLSIPLAKSSFDFGFEKIGPHLVTALGLDKQEIALDNTVSFSSVPFENRLPQGPENIFDAIQLPVTHKVQAGETLNGILDKQNSSASIQDIQQLNPSLINPNQISVGQKITIPTSLRSAISNMELDFQNIGTLGMSMLGLTQGNNKSQFSLPAAQLPGQVQNVQEGDIFYTVVKGDTLSSISQFYTGDPSKYQLIAEASEINNADKLIVGQRVTIPVRILLASRRAG